MRRGGAYWYGYRRVQQKVVKRYIGKTADLSIARLESIAKAFAGESPPAVDGSHRGEETITSYSDTPSSLSAGATERSLVYLNPLLEPKLHLPRLPSSLVERPRLLTQLDATLVYKLTLLSAPAGFGKTTLISQWIINRHVYPSIAWVSLDAGDNDPVRFWRYIMTACQSLRAGLGATALSLLSTVPQPLFEMPSLKASAALLRLRQRTAVYLPVG